ncbi:hypothetical protein FBZ82_103272 [Azospirillum brasilense]|uniref:Uncharacterized protein n=1 Tax=Azospirillum brasilense TaxID=192 RepID=A0A560BFA4_AZOBR|nr:hypothetical protein [Azospirillum brasilense]TWA71298.1 hypothetical protein FBZ82_103272 [Azospirillum brasilense]
MRCQQFLETIKKCFDKGLIDYAKFEEFSTSKAITGGWEVWLQLEIAYGFLKISTDEGYGFTCVREEVYPYTAMGQYINRAGVTLDRRSAACSDFFLRKTGLLYGDDTYVELKCINQSHVDPLGNAWRRFDNDIQKQTDLFRHNPNLNCISVLVARGHFPENAVRGEHPALARYWENGKRVAYIYDLELQSVTKLEDVDLNRKNRPFFIAVSVINQPEYKGAVFRPELWGSPMLIEEKSLFKE